MAVRDIRCTTTLVTANGAAARLKIPHSNSSTYGSSELCASTRQDKFTSPTLQKFISAKKFIKMIWKAFKRRRYPTVAHVLNDTKYQLHTSGGIAPGPRLPLRDINERECCA
ncbi:hypothetical protein CBL_05379 [Carabus blaptoides fortunei]